jgi:hypothetical protein
MEREIVYGCRVNSEYLSEEMAFRRRTPTAERRGAALRLAHPRNEGMSLRIQGVTTGPADRGTVTTVSRGATLCTSAVWETTRCVNKQLRERSDKLTETPGFGHNC